MASRHLPPDRSPRTKPRVLSHEDELLLDRDVHHEYVDEQYGKENYDPFQLDAPPPRAGYVQRWVRVTLVGSVDVNASYSIRDNWRPRTDLPDRFKPINYAFQNQDRNQTVDYLQVGDLVLMEKPIKFHSARMAHFKDKDKQIMQAIDAELDGVESKQHPIFRRRKTETETGSRDIPNINRDTVSPGSSVDDL